MPCSQDHFIPILDEIDQRAKEAEAREALRKRRGGPRPGSGPPKGNLNALKHGRFSRRHKIILEAILEVPAAREALIGVMKRNRQRQKQAELEAAYILCAGSPPTTRSSSPPPSTRPVLSGRLGPGEDTNGPPPTSTA